MPRNRPTRQQMTGWMNGHPPRHSSNRTDGSESAWSNEGSGDHRHREREAWHAESSAASVERERELRDRVRQLEEENQTLRGEKDNERMFLSVMSKALYENHTKVQSLEAELQKEKEEKQSTQLEATQYRDQVADYRQQLAEQAPLVRIGERVRLRFLEQERLTYATDGTTREQLDQQKIDEGNEAAHGGNGTADAAVIQSLERRRINVECYRALFKNMYSNTPEHHQIFPLRFQKVHDIRVSILAGTGIHAGLGTEQERQEAVEVTNELWRRYDFLGMYSEAAARDPEIDRLLAQAEEMKAELVNSHNQRRGRRVRPTRNRYVADLGDTGGADDEYAYEQQTSAVTTTYDYEFPPLYGS